MNTREYLKKSLMELDFGEGGSALYLTLLDCPGANGSYLREKTKYSNAAVYKILNSLLDKGFICRVDDYPAKYFSIPLDRIAQKISNRGRKIVRLGEKLKNLDRIGRMPCENSEVYEDNAFTDFYLNIPYKINDGFIWCVGSYGAVRDFFGVEVEREFVMKRLGKGVNCDALIFDDNSFSRKFGSSNRSERRETKFLPVKNYPSEFTYLFDDELVTFYKDYDDKIKILRTSSSSLAKAKLLQYQMIWKSTVE